MRRVELLNRSSGRRWDLGGIPGRLAPGSGGFTLVELIVVMAIFGLVMAALYNIFASSNRLYLAQDEIVDAQQQARTGLEIIGRQVRMAGYISSKNSATGADPITSGAWSTAPGAATAAIEEAQDPSQTGNGSTVLSFKADLDGDTNTDAVRYVYYTNAATNVALRNTITCQITTWNGGWGTPTTEQVFLDNIQAFSLTYQMADGTTSTHPDPATLANIRGVTINLTAQTQNAVEPYQSGKGIRTRQLVSNIQIRNAGLT
jgi:prepilin-type N-terminal cleavage/methylation domain-containing protein